jgi:hypothetical protein
MLLVGVKSALRSRKNRQFWGENEGFGVVFKSLFRATFYKWLYIMELQNGAKLRYLRATGWLGFGTRVLNVIL